MAQSSNIGGATNNPGSNNPALNPNSPFILQQPGSVNVPGVFHSPSHTFGSSSTNSCPPVTSTAIGLMSEFVATPLSNYATPPSHHQQQQYQLSPVCPPGASPGSASPMRGGGGSQMSSPVGYSTAIRTPLMMMGSSPASGFLSPQHSIIGVHPPAYPHPASMSASMLLSQSPQQQTLSAGTDSAHQAQFGSVANTTSGVSANTTLSVSQSLSTSSGGPTTQAATTKQTHQAVTQISPIAGLKGLNPLVLCHYGQDYVHEILTRCHDVFNLLKIIQPPNGTIQCTTLFADRQTKLKQLLECVTLLLKRVRYIYGTVNQSCEELQLPPVSELIRYVGDNVDVTSDEFMDTCEDQKKTSKEYSQAIQEREDLQKQLEARNRYLKCMIDRLRTTVCDISTMMAARGVTN